MKYHPHLTSFFLWVVLTLGIFFIADFYLHPEPILSFAIAITAGTLLLYGVDKFQAMREGRRIPERILHLTALLGGSLGALIGMELFRHKTRKTSFQFILALLILAQVALILWLLAKAGVSL